MKRHTATETTYFIAHNGVDVFHNGEIESGRRVDTGQPELEIFTNKQEYLDRCAELGIVIEP